MDTISRENNSMLPVGGIIVGIIALVIGGYAAVTGSTVKKNIAAQDERIAAIESQVAAAVATSEKNDKTIKEVARQTQDGFNTVTTMLSELRGSVTKLEDLQKKPVAPGGKKGPSEVAVAGPGEHVVKPGDTGAKIAREHDVSLSDLLDVNPSANWNKLKPGDKVKLPQKR